MPSRHDEVIQQPGSQPVQLILLLHANASTPAAMAPLGRRLGEAFPGAMIVGLAGMPCGALPDAFEWVVTDESTPGHHADRHDAALPWLREAVTHWQHESGVTPHGTCLIGFSHGASLALASTQDLTPGPDLAGRVVALSGRLSTLPHRVPPATTVHMIHGKDDAVTPYGLTVQAAEHWIALGADVTADVIPFLGHAVTLEVADLVVERLTTTIPKRLWDEAMRAADAAG